MFFTKEPMQFEFYVKQLSKLMQNITVPKLDHVVPTKHCYHSNDYQDHRKCAVFEPTTFIIYEFEIKRYVTDKERDELKQIAWNKVPQSLRNNDRVEECVAKLNSILQNAYYYKIANFEIDEGILHLTIGKLIAFNNIITCGSFLMLRQKQMLCWVQECKQFKWTMDVRCIRYHLNMLLYMFNKRKINTE